MQLLARKINLENELQEKEQIVKPSWARKGDVTEKVGQHRTFPTFKQDLKNPARQRK